jgi:type VI secretion system FHA domain protein
MEGSYTLPPVAPLAPDALDDAHPSTDVSPPEAIPPANYNPLAPDSGIIKAQPSPRSKPVSLPSKSDVPPSSSGRRTSTPVEVPVDRPSPDRPSPPAAELAAILRAAGLSNVEVTPELAENLGRIFRIVVRGVVELLRARQAVKDELRMRMTQIKSSDNNPLKFAASVDETLRKLFVDRDPAYLPPVEAFTEAFTDLQDHQIAMVAGLRVAFESMLAEFDPDRLEEQFDRQFNRGALLSVPAKMRYWEAYRDKSQQLLKDIDVTYRRWFGEEFIAAYEEQLERLEAQRREKPST